MRTMKTERSTLVLHRYQARGGGMPVNAYLVEGALGLVAVDATLTVSDGRALRALADGLGKPLVGWWSRIRVPTTTAGWSSETQVRQKVRHFRPSQIERATAAPGARIPVRESRIRALELGRGRCPAGTVPTAVRGELWGDVTNGLGLEAVTPAHPLRVDHFSRDDG